MFSGENLIFSDGFGDFYEKNESPRIFDEFLPDKCRFSVFDIGHVISVSLVSILFSLINMYAYLKKLINNDFLNQS